MSSPDSPSSATAYSSPLSSFDKKIGRTYAEKRALNILEPSGEGENPPGGENPSAMDALTALMTFPTQIAKVHAAIEHIARRIDILAGPFVWLNCADTSNLATTAVGSNQYAPAFLGYTDSQAAVLRNVVVGASIPTTIQIVKTRNAGRAYGPATLLPQMVTVTMCTVRTASAFLTIELPQQFIVEQGYYVYMISIGSQACNLDFSCDYRFLPDM